MVYENVKTRLNLGNAGYYVVQDLLCSIWLSKDVKIKIKNYNNWEDVAGGWRIFSSEKLHDLFSLRIVIKMTK
jgi:hypothetical protein